MWTRINQLCLFMLVTLLLGCAPLNPTNTTMEDVGEVTIRAIIFPLTLGTSEWMIADQRKREASPPRYYGGGSSDAAILMVMPPLFTQPATIHATPVYQPTRMPSCWTTQSGQAYYTNCY